MSRVAGIVTFVLVLAACGSNGNANDSASESSGPTSTTTIATAPAVAASAGCGAAVAPGRSDHAIEVDGLDRTYLQQVPASYDGTSPVPLVVDMHGLTSSGEAEATVSGFAELSESEGFVVVWPNGTGLVPYWNIVSGGRADGDPEIEELLSRVVDDVSFLDQLVDHLVSELCVDTNRVYATGLSNGGLMASVAGCDLADTFAAVASVAGTLAPADCDRGAPILSIHGDADDVVLFDGGLGQSIVDLIESQQFTEGTPLADQAAIVDVIDGILPPVRVALEEWAALNGCDPEPTVEQIGTDVEHRTWTGCDADVEQYIVAGGGHTWPGSAALRAAVADNPDLADTLGAMTESLDSTAVIWAFFGAHTLAAD